MTDHKTPLKFPNQVEQKNFNPVAPPQYKRDKNVINILLILESVESASQPTLRKSMLCTIEAHSQIEYIRGCAVQLMHIVSKIEGCAVQLKHIINTTEKVQCN